MSVSGGWNLSLVYVHPRTAALPVSPHRHRKKSGSSGAIMVVALGVEMDTGCTSLPLHELA